MSQGFGYQFPFGAQMIDARRSRFRIWAPAAQAPTLEILDGEQANRTYAMQPEDHGFWSCIAPVGAGSAYYYRLDDGFRVPDPASRLQRGDVHDPSLVVDPRDYQWQHPQWPGRPWPEMVIYEVHPGCWGGFKGIEKKLGYLAELGITAVELMPVADFPGQRNWGYDGALPFAPDRSYGDPNDLKHLIDTAHGLDLCVYLDVVYNHFGPEGNYLHTYAPSFFDENKSSPWGAQIDFSRREVRDFFTENALYWLMEYRFDGLRFDAVHAISEKDWLDEMAARVRQTVEPGRHVHLVLENERNRAEHLQRDFDAQWNDDGHNVLHVLLTGEREGYYANYLDQPLKKLARMLETGFVYQGQPSPIHDNKPRGTPSGHLPPHQFVLFLQNHDQVGNRAYGERLTTLCHPLALRAAVTLQLLNPQIPLLFMDEERCSTVPFLYFTDFHGELAAAVRDGRRREFRAFSAFANPEAQAAIPDPNEESTFQRSAAFDPSDDPEQTACYEFYRELLTLRRKAVIPWLDSTSSISAKVQGDHAVLVAWQMGVERILWMAVNLSDQDQSSDAPPGELLFESRQNAGQAAKQGRIPYYSTSIFLEHIANPED